MTLIRIYIFNQKLIIPKVAETADGFFVDIAPVKVLPMQQVKDWSEAIYKALIAGNNAIPTPDGSDEPGSAILDSLNITKWSTFETQAIMYTVHVGGRYISLYRTGKAANGMWDNSSMEQRNFDPRTPKKAVVAALVADIKRQPEFKPPSTGLLVLPKEDKKEDKKEDIKMISQKNGN